jgi:hypothetical protein
MSETTDDDGGRRNKLQCEIGKNGLATSQRRVIVSPRVFRVYGTEGTITRFLAFPLLARGGNH